MRLQTLLGAGLCLTTSLYTGVKAGSDEPDLAAMPGVVQEEIFYAEATPAPGPTATATAVNEYPRKAPDTPRHREERGRLFKRLNRARGTWNERHVRHRLLDALYGFVKYQKRQAEELERYRKLYSRVSKEQQELLEKTVRYSERFNEIEKLQLSNQALCDRMVQNALEYYSIGRQELDEHVSKLEREGKKPDRTSVSQSMKHFVRDWTVSGGVYERDTCFSCLTSVLEKLFPKRDKESDSLSVLVPGAGLGRLGHTIANMRGFEVTINEWSMFMNVAYRFLESAATQADSESVHPFVDGWSHHISSADMQRQYTFPDANVNSSRVLLVEGDFTTVFSGKTVKQHDVIVTYFFIDTARNIANYFDTIQTLLKPGGYWINLGPLLYGSSPVVQLSLEEIIDYVEEGLGFKFLDVAGSECGEPTIPGRLVRGLQAPYGYNDRALTRNAYNAQFWVAQKSEA